MNCENCEKNKDIEMAMIPFAAHQAEMSRSERQHKALVWIIVLLILLLVGSNVGWLIYESQFETVENWEEVIVDAEGNGDANYIGQDGNIYNGEDYSTQKD